MIEQEAIDATPVNFEIYSKNGRLLDTVDNQTRGEQLLDVWCSAKFLVGVAANGDRTCVRERTELR
jgi:hypothetical protein